MTEEIAPKLRLVQVFLSSATFKHQGEPLGRAPNTPQGSQQCSIRISFTDLNDGKTVRVTLGVATKPMESALYEFDVEMVALIEKGDDVARALPQEDLVEIGATLLFPYAREVITSLTSRGRFSPVWLNPFNVRAALDAATVSEVSVPAQAKK